MKIPILVPIDFFLENLILSNRTHHNTSDSLKSSVVAPFAYNMITAPGGRCRVRSPSPTTALESTTSPRQGVALFIYFLYDFLIFVPIIFLFFIATVILSISNDLLSLFAIGNYQIRYIFLFILYLLQIKLNISDFRNIIYGFSFSLFFLLIESSFFTLSNGRDHLISGTLAAKVFANITASITLFFVFINPIPE